MASQVVCISHSTGAGGEDVGRAVAEQLGFRYVDNEVIAQAAEWADLDPAFVANAERRKPFVARLLGQAVEQTPLRLSPAESARRMPTDADLRMLISDVLRSFVDQGSVVIVAHAGSFALAGHDVLRVFLTASPETRAMRVAAARRIDENRAARVVKEEDVARADYLKRFYAVDHELPIHFDVVINTDILAPEKAAGLVVLAAS